MNDLNGNKAHSAQVDYLLKAQKNDEQRVLLIILQPP